MWLRIYMRGLFFILPNEPQNLASLKLNFRAPPPSLMPVFPVPSSFYVFVRCKGQNVSFLISLRTVHSAKFTLESISGYPLPFSLPVTIGL